MGDDAGQSAATSAPPAQAEQVPTIERQIILKEIKAKLDAALAAEIGFAERLVWFWSNHFCVSAEKVPNMAGGYEREAIRPHILGRYVDMLLAVEGHPAMLVYLDNFISIGPNSVAGINRTRGLNENLAREILELHTLGVRTGYSQDDVLSFAKVLTGWTIISANDNPEHGAEFIFNRRLHEPGPQRVMDRTYADTGVEQGRAVLKELARHPATATHVATKLARHFVADEPSPALVERLDKIFRDTDGDLKEIAKGLIAAPEAWTPVQSKLKRPSEWVFGHGARDRPARRSRAVRARSGVARRADVAAALPEGLRRRRGRLDRHHGAAARHRQQFRRARRRTDRPEGGGRDRPRADRFGRNASGRRACGEPPAGPRARFHVARISAEVIMALLHLPTRREMLVGTGSLFAWAHTPKLARAEGRDPRVLVIVLRGALDGLGMVAPVGDPDWVSLRGDRALVLDGKPAALPLDSFFALNPAMPNLHRLYQAQQAIIVHAAATPYRERSHFDGQDVLESGLAKPGATDSGWLNRALSSLAADGRVDPQGSRAFAVGPVTPLVVRGTAPIMSWSPQRLLPASDDTQMRLLDLYRHTDAKLARAFEGRRDLAALARTGGIETMPLREGEAAPQTLVAFGNTSETLRARPRNTSHSPTARAWVRRASWAGIPTSTKAPPAGNSPRSSVRSMRPLPRSRRPWPTPGARR